MKKVLSFIVLAVSLFFANPAQAQIKLGVKGGLNVSNLKLDDDMWTADNKAGFFIGPMVKVTVPVTGLSFDVAALYDQKEAKMHWADDVVGGDLSQTTTIKQQYIDIPVNVRYGVGLGSLANVFVLQVHSGASMLATRTSSGMPEAVIPSERLHSVSM